nr:hypothetical protein OH820_28040 [Streptomyces sp. NBC_00857]
MSPSPQYGERRGRDEDSFRPRDEHDRDEESFRSPERDGRDNGPFRPREPRGRDEEQPPPRQQQGRVQDPLRSRGRYEESVRPRERRGRDEELFQPRDPGGPGDNPLDTQVEQYNESPVGPLVRERRPPYRRESGQIVAVLLYSNGGHSVVWPNRREDHDKPMLRPPFTVFEVLLGRNVTSFDLALPAAGDAQFFEARVECHWEVEDPYAVVDKRVWDVRELLHGELLLELRQVSRRFRLTDAQRADEAVQEELRKGRIELGRDLGLRLTIHVFIDLSDAVRRRKSERDEIDFDMSKNEAQAEADLRREALERRLVRERAAELESVLRRGEEAEIINLMAKNPDKEWEIRSAIREEKREGQADFLNLFNRLLDTGHLERHDVGDQMYETLRMLRESGGAVIGGVTDQLLLGQPQRRELEEGPGSGERRGYGRGDRDRDRDRGSDSDSDRGWDRDRDRDRDRDQDGDRGGGRGRTEDRDRDWDRERERGRDRDRAPEPQRPPWDDEPRVYRPTRVESAAERDRNDRRDREEERDRGDERGGSRRAARPSSDFDDWGDE